DPEGKVMRRTFLHPLLQESSRVRFEESAGVGVTRRGYRASHRHPFGNNKLEFPLVRRADTQHGNRTFFDLELNACTETRFSVILLQTSQYRLALGDGHIVRPVMPYENEILFEVHGVEFRKTSSDTKPIHDKHGNTCFEIRLAAHRKPGSCEQRIAYDQVRHHLARDAIRLALVIIGKAVKVL